MIELYVLISFSVMIEGGVRTDLRPPVSNLTQVECNNLKRMRQLSETPYNNELLTYRTCRKVIQ